MRDILEKDPFKVLVLAVIAWLVIYGPALDDAAEKVIIGIVSLMGGSLRSRGNGK